MDFNKLYYSGFPITSLTEHRVLKLTNHYHTKSYLVYLKDLSLPLNFSVFTYSLLANLLILSFRQINIYADNIEIHVDYHQSSNIHLQ